MNSLYDNSKPLPDSSAPLDSMVYSELPGRDGGLPRRIMRREDGAIVINEGTSIRDPLKEELVEIIVSEWKRLRKYPQYSDHTIKTPCPRCKNHAEGYRAVEHRNSMEHIALINGMTEAEFDAMPGDFDIFMMAAALAREEAPVESAFDKPNQAYIKRLLANATSSASGSSFSSTSSVSNSSVIGNTQQHQAYSANPGANSDILEKIASKLSMFSGGSK